MADSTTIQINGQDTTFARNGKTFQITTRVPAYTGLQGFLPGFAYQYLANSPNPKPTFIRLLTALLGNINLQNLYTLDPFSADFENNTLLLYTRSFALAYATAQSGPTNVRGGTYRQGVELAELGTLFSINRFKEIWAQRLALSQIVIAAASAANQYTAEIDRMTLADNEQEIMNFHANQQAEIGFLGQIQAQNQSLVQAFAANMHYGNDQMETDENLSGTGTQGSAAQSRLTSWR